MFMAWLVIGLKSDMQSVFARFGQLLGYGYNSATGIVDVRAIAPRIEALFWS